jgi:hypothetical protein
MKSDRWFNRNRFTSIMRVAIAGAFVTTAAGLAFVAAKSSSPLPAAESSSPPLAAKPDGKVRANLEAKFVRNKRFADHFKTLLGRAKSSGEGSRIDGPAQEAYDNRAYPSKWIGAAEQRAARAAANALWKGGKHTSSLLTSPSSSPLSAPLLLTSYPGANWTPLGPDGVPASGIVVNESTGGTSPTIFSGRATAIAVAPHNCSQGGPCTVFIGAAGGGVWRTDNALDATPTWTQVSDDAATGIPSNAIGSIVFDPHDVTDNTLYVGTGEPNGSGDSEAGVGLYRTFNALAAIPTWELVAGSTAASAPCATENPAPSPAPSVCPVATGRSIGAIAIDPDPAKTGPTTRIFIGTDVARHGSSSVNGGRFTPPGSAKVGLYESTDNGATFTEKVILAQDPISVGSSNGADFFRGGCSDIELYRPASETQVYASFFAYGLFRERAGDTGTFCPGTGSICNGFRQVFKSGGGGSAGQSIASRTEFSLAPNGDDLRIYVGDAAATAAFPNGLGQLYRVDDANVVNTQLLNNAGNNVGWTLLSCPSPGTSCFSSYNYCGGQCTYDMPVYSPPGSPDIVYIGGAMQYDEIFTNHPPSNGRAVQRSEDAGASFTDMTVDTNGRTRHPDQHAIAAAPFDPNILFNADDGGIWRLDGTFTNAAIQCDSRGLSSTDLTDCHMWLLKIPTSITSLNDELETLQYQSLSLDPNAPLDTLLGGTQDNGTHSYENGNWSVSVFGDGGQSGISKFNSNIRFHNYFEASPDVNFHGANEVWWDWIGDPLFEVEPQSFYIPMIFDPQNAGYMYAGLDFVWRTTDNGGNQATLDAHCNELSGDFPANVTCGDWVRLAQGKNKALGDGKFWGNDKLTAGYVVATERAPNDNGTLWVGTRRGRVFVTKNVNAVNPSTVNFFRIDTSAQPSRFVSGIDIDPSNPNHAFISYSGYNAYAAQAGTAQGHVFEVTYNPATHTATWSGDLAGGSPGLGDQPITDIAVDWNTQVAGTPDIYVSTDFGVFVRAASDTTQWQEAASGLPPVAVYGLTIHVGSRVLYAATHGRSAWKLTLP